MLVAPYGYQPTPTSEDHQMKAKLQDFRIPDTEVIPSWVKDYNQPSNLKGLKYDTGKLPLDLLDVDALSAVADVLAFGAKKYHAENWREGVSYRRVYGAIMRHLFRWWKGEKADEETGLHPLAHAMCELMFLLNYELNNRTELDDRYVAKEEG